MSKSYEKLVTLLKQMFQMDQADLDFGIYRIMNYKRKEIEKFLNEDLLPQVRVQLEKYISVKQKSLRKELEELKKTLDETGVVYESSAKYVALKNQLESGMNMDKIEDEVYSHLTDFFSRYYNNGDFISQRRYKQGVYAIPYEGEEVKLYWANADQYYIKTTEYFRDYIFTLPDGKKVHFKLVEASTDKDNNKPPENKERRFVLYQDEPVKVENGELIIKFEYKVHESKQRDLNDEAIKKVIEIFNSGKGAYSQFLGIFTPSPTEANPGRTLFEKHLNDYTARNTFDYFIHKDLGGFLRRELDFYLKNEVIFLDDLDTEHEVRIEQYITKVKVIKNIGYKIIAFLEQLENFQKKLWLKKKFVVETNYCITLDRIDEKFYPEIAANRTQVEEWKKLFAIDELEGFIEPLTVEFLKTNPYLLLDTAFFGEEFKEKLIQSIDNVDEKTDGLLIKSENFQALNLLMERYKEKVKCVYIDPPYNTGDDGFLYKDNLMHSSWASFVNDRINISKRLMTNDGKFAVSIDDREIGILIHLCKSHFGASKIIAVKMSEASGVKMTSVKNRGTIPKYKEYLIINAKEVLDNMFFDYIQKNEWDKEYNKFIDGFDKDDYEKLTKLLSSDEMNEEIIDEINSICARWNLIGLGEQERKLNIKDTELLKWRMENAYRIVRTAASTSVKEIALENYKKYPNHKIFCALSKRDKIPYFIDATFDKNAKKPRVQILFAIDNLSVHPGDFWSDINTTGLEAEGDVDFKNGKKPLKLMERIIKAITNEADFVLDFFAGSGTTAHAVINLNREDGGSRKYILVEMGEYFDTVLKPRIQKVIYSKDWKDGKPVSREGISHMFKYMKLESYEDALNNLEIRRSDDQQMILDLNRDLREQYILSYILDKETEGSMSLLNIDQFANPFDYKMKIANGVETKETVVDLVETFNYLVGLVVTRIDAKASFNAEPDETSDIPGAVRLIPAKDGKGEYTFKEVEGHTLLGDKVLIIWRNLTSDIAKDNAALDAYFRKKKYSTQDFEYDRIYVNGDNNLQNMKQEGERWKVLLIEEEFKRLMFDGAEF